MSSLPCTIVHLKSDPENAVYSVALRHYEDLKDRLDRNEKGWIELESIYDVSGKLLCRLEDITDMFYAPEPYCLARDDWDKQQKAENLTE